MFEFEGAFEGIWVADGADGSLIEASGSLGGVDDIVSAGDCGVESWDERLGKSDGGGYFWKKRSRRGGSDLAISTDCWTLIVDVMCVAIGVEEASCRMSKVTVPRDILA
jgi:hypothetical protein